jgi:hypothetical protein
MGGNALDQLVEVDETKVQHTTMKKHSIRLTLVLSALMLVASSVSAQWQLATGSGDISAFAHFNSVILAIGEKIYSSTNNGIKWTLRYPSPHATDWLRGTPATAVIGSHVFMGGAHLSNPKASWNTTNFGGVYRSIDTGLTWSRTSQGLGDTNVFSLLTAGPKLFAGTGSGLYVSSDEGANWNSAGLPLSVIVSSLAAIGNTILAGTDKGLFRSADGGLIWSGANADLKFGPDYLGTALVVNRLNVFASAVYQGKSQYPYLLSSSDSGTSWAVENIRSAFGSYIADSGLLFQALTYSAGVVLMSTNNGGRWIDVTDTGFGGMGIFHRAQALVVSGPNLIVGTVNTGLWYRPLATILNKSSVDHVTPFEVNFEIYPNPLTISTSISFSTKQRSFVEVKIVDVLGKQCTELFKGVLEPGMHSYKWNAATMTGGVYFCTVRTEDGIEQLPMIVQH